MHFFKALKCLSVVIQMFLQAINKITCKPMDLLLFWPLQHLQLVRSKFGHISPITFTWALPVKGDKTKQASIFFFPFFLALAHYKQWCTEIFVCQALLHRTFHVGRLSCSVICLQTKAHQRFSQQFLSASDLRESGLHSKVSYYCVFIPLTK